MVSNRPIQSAILRPWRRVPIGAERAPEGGVVWAPKRRLVEVVLESQPEDAHVLAAGEVQPRARRQIRIAFACPVRFSMRKSAGARRGGDDAVRRRVVQHPSLRRARPA